MTDQLLLLTLFHQPEPVFISQRVSGPGGRRGIALQNWNAQTWDLTS